MNEKQKIALTMLVFSVLLGTVGVLNYLKYKDRDKLLARIDSLKKEESRANDMISQIPDLRDKRSNLANIIDQYASILPAEEHVQHEAFADIIDSYSRETNVVIEKVEYVTQSDEELQTADENFVRHRYRLSLVGNFRNFLRFVNKIENHTRFLKIDEIFLKPLGSERSVAAGNEAAVLEMAKVPFKTIELVLSTYTYKKETVRK